MLQTLASHNDDIKRLMEKGYAVAVDSNCLIVRDIPYLDHERQLKWGAIVSKLMFVDDKKVTMDDHQIYFSGSAPYNLDGTPIRNLGGGATQIQLSAASSDVVVQRSFSNKPRGDKKFADFFEKIESYVGIISGPAIVLHGANPLTFRCVEQPTEDSVFKFQDTLTSRAQISDLAAKFKDDAIAIIGLGGTGSYILDFLAKTPVKEIRVFDLDRYYVHNAFRSPGRLHKDELGKHKAEVFEGRYENFRHGLSCHLKYIDETSREELQGVTFAFVCVDKGSSRSRIFDLLISMKIPFIDVGMGLKRKPSGTLNGLIRTTYFPAEDAQQVREKCTAPTTDNPGDIYKTNIQIGELNALNACLAVIRFKQLRGFYSEQDSNYELLFEINDLKIVGSCNDEV